MPPAPRPLDAISPGPTVVEKEIREDAHHNANEIGRENLGVHADKIAQKPEHDSKNHKIYDYPGSTNDPKLQESIYPPFKRKRVHLSSRGRNKNCLIRAVARKANLLVNAYRRIIFIVYVERDSRIAPLE